MTNQSKQSKQLKELSLFKIANIVALETKVPTLFLGAPGSTKTASINGLFESINVLTIPVLCSTLSPSDVLGFPYRDAEYKFEDAHGNKIQGMLKFSPPWWAVKALEASASGKYKAVVLFFDELLTSTPAVQAGLLRPLNEGYVGDYYIGHIVRIAAANAKGQSSGFNASQALENRFVTYKENPSHSDWENDYILDNSPEHIDYVPYDGKFKDVLNKIYIDYIKTDKIKILDGDVIPQGAFPSKRSITSLSKIIHFAVQNHLPDDFVRKAIAGTIGASYSEVLLHLYKELKPFDFTYDIHTGSVDQFRTFIRKAYEQRLQITPAIRKRLSELYISAAKFEHTRDVLIEFDTEVSEMLKVNKAMVGLNIENKQDNGTVFSNIGNLTFKPIK